MSVERGKGRWEFNVEVAPHHYEFFYLSDELLAKVNSKRAMEIFDKRMHDTIQRVQALAEGNIYDQKA